MPSDLHTLCPLGWPGSCLDCSLVNDDLSCGFEKSKLAERFPYVWQQRKWPADEYSGGPDEKRDLRRGWRCRIKAVGNPRPSKEEFDHFENGEVKKIHLCAPKNTLVEFIDGSKIVGIRYPVKRVR